MSRSLVVLALLLALCATLAAAAPVTYPAAKLVGQITLDGNLNEPAWQAAPVSSDFIWPVERVKPAAPDKPTPTNFRVLTTPDAIYLGVYCAEPMMDKLQDAPIEHGNIGILGRDEIEIFMDCEGRGFNYYQLILAASNDHWSAYFIEAGNTGGGPYDPDWESAIHKGPDFWSAEVKLPLTCFYYTPSALFSDTWKFNVVRSRQPQWELLTWSPTRTGFHDITRYHHISGMPKKAPQYDLGVSSITANLLSRADTGYRGSLTLNTTATAAAAGAYKLSLWLDGKPLVTDKPVEISPNSGALVLPDLTFPRLGKAMVKAHLADAKGVVRAALNYQVKLNYQDLVVDIERPFYRGNIYPTQDVPEISGKVTVNLPEESLKGATLETALIGPNGSVGTSSSPLEDRVGRFSIDATNLKVGDYRVHTAVALGRAILAEKDTPIRKLAKPQEGSCVWFDENLNIVMNGRPFFMRAFEGAYANSTWQWLKYSQPRGDFVTFSGGAGIEAERLDKAEVERVKTDVEPLPSTYDAMLKIIEGAKKNPNMIWYYLSDEPECRGLSPVYLKHQYEFIKAHDPYHPVLIVTRDPATYLDCADVLSPHQYLNPQLQENGKRTMTSPKTIRDQMRTILTKGNGRVGCWFEPQAFSYGFADVRAQYPTFLEFRCMVWTAIANGARGLTPFFYAPHFQDVDLRLGIPFIYETIGCLERFLTAPLRANQVLQVTAPEDGVDARLIRVGDEVLLIAVNLLDKPVRAEFSSDALKRIPQLLGVRETLTAKVNAGKLALDFKPYQVHLLSNARLLPENGDGARTVDDMVAEIARARAALKKPGNLLFGRGRDLQFASSDTYTNANDALVNGITDDLGFKQVVATQGHPWFTVAFQNGFQPTFRTVKLYSITVADVRLDVWNGTDWQPVAESKDNRGPVIVLHLDQPISPSKFRVVMTQGTPLGSWVSWPNAGWGAGGAEVYELELYN